MTTHSTEPTGAGGARQAVSGSASLPTRSRLRLVKYRLVGLLALASLVPPASFAQTDAGDEAESLRIYDVEIAIFKNLRVPKGREYVLPVSAPGRSEKLFDLSSAASVEAGREMGFELLASDEYRLLDQVARLIESPRYELLLHAGWRQPGLERGKAIPVWIKGGRIYGNEYTSIDSRIEMLDSRPDNETAAGKNFEFDEQSLEAQELQLQAQLDSTRHGGLYEIEGKITVALARYLHTYVELVLRRPRLASDPALNNAATDAYLQANFADTLILNNHLLREHRRMRSKNLHYLDSPQFAMLILITPYEAPQVIDEDPVEEQPQAEVSG